MIYKGYTIEKSIFRGANYTVFYNGDEILFNTIEEAKAFIDEITK